MTVSPSVFLSLKVRPMILSLKSLPYLKFNLGLLSQPVSRPRPNRPMPVRTLRRVNNVLINGASCETPALLWIYTSGFEKE